MKKISNARPFRPASNVIDFGSRMAKRAALAKGIPVYDGYEMPPQLAQRDRTVTQEAEFDAKSARESAIAGLQSFLSDTFNLDQVLTALNFAPDKKGRLASDMDLMTLLEEIFDPSAYGLDQGFPDFVVTMPASPSSIVSSIMMNLIPDNVAMAYVTSGGLGDKVLLSSGIGFKDMHMQGEIAILMALVEKVRLRGIPIEPQTALGRLVDVTGKNTARLNSPIAPEIDLLSNGALVTVPASRYTRDLDLITANTALDPF